MAKAVMLSHYNITSNLYSMSRVEKAYDTDINMAFLPFHHTFGSTWMCEEFRSKDQRETIEEDLRSNAPLLKREKWFKRI